MQYSIRVIIAITSSPSPSSQKIVKTVCCA